MLNIIQPFFEDNYKIIWVREYARLQKVSPPSASSLLNNFVQEGLLLKHIDRRYHFFYPNRESFTFVKLQQAYYKEKFNGLLKYLQEETVLSTIIIFGSIAKAEVNQHSD